MGKERKTKTVDGHNDHSNSMRRGTRYSADDPGGVKFGRSVMQVGAGLKRALGELANTTGDSAILQRTSMDFKNFGPRKF